MSLIKKHSFVVAIILLLLCYASFLNAKIISNSQIIASTDLIAVHHRGFVPSSIEQVTDQLVSDSPFFDGFITRAAAGVITLELDGVYELREFLLWNSVNLNGQHGVKSFALEFFDKNHTLIKRLTHRQDGKPFIAEKLHLKVQRFAFTTPIKNVKKVNFIINNAYKDEIRLREVAFEGLLIAPKSLAAASTQKIFSFCSVWNDLSWVNDIDLHRLNKQQFELSFKSPDIFKNQVINLLKRINNEYPNAGSIKMFIEVSFQGNSDLPEANLSIHSNAITWNTQGQTSTQFNKIQIINTNQWAKLASSVDVLNQQGKKMAVFSINACANSQNYLRILSTDNPENFTVQISDGNKITKTFALSNQKINNKTPQEYLPAFGKSHKSIRLQKTSGNLSFVKKEFNVATLSYPTQFDFVNHGKFDDNRRNRIFLHTFNFKIPPNCQIQQATFEVLLTNLGGLFSNDTLYFYENGSIIYYYRIWSKSDGKSKHLKINLGDTEAKLNTKEKLINTLKDGDFSLAIQDDTSVDYVKLDITLFGDKCSLGVGTMSTQ